MGITVHSKFFHEANPFLHQYVDTVFCKKFPLKYFYGDSVNAIKIQIWVALIANLLITIVKKRVKRPWSFSNLVTIIRQTLMYYINVYAFCENPEKAWLSKIKQREKKPVFLTLFD
jgi:sorbitol-specific phosphotransferase system component IIC